MAMNWPTFEVNFFSCPYKDILQTRDLPECINIFYFQEYTPELKPISKKELPKGGDGIVLVGQKPAVISPPVINSSAATNAHPVPTQKFTETTNATGSGPAAVKYDKSIFGADVIMTLLQQ